jgi:predicted membrane protein (TIGR00267 family)
VKAFSRLSWRENIFALVVGLTDGILTALTLASGELLAPAGKITISLGLRIAVASSLSGIFIFFTADYARLRQELVHASKQLNLASHGRLATTQLGKAVQGDAVGAAFVSSLFNFLGAISPLIIGVAFPAPRWLPIVAAVAMLGILGATLARTLYGNMARWSVALMISGTFLAIVGMEIHLV